jgi:hypothetical protein
MLRLFEKIVRGDPVGRDAGDAIGKSREGRPVRAFRFGRGRRRVSLLGGCHADEPVGPRLLRQLVGYLTNASHRSTLVRDYEWWVIPHINPDSERRNRSWHTDDDEFYDLASYLTHAVREAPGDDIEFGFPRGPDDAGARPENLAAYHWWKEADGPFDLHASLHGMGFGAGPWFLVDRDWSQSYDRIRAICAGRVRQLGYVLHDVERRGEKGFVRLEPGFCTRPDSRYMREYFLKRGDEATAALFRPSSMETIRSLDDGNDALTLVSEMPLFLTPGVGRELGPPDPVREEWQRLTQDWRRRLGDGKPTEEIATEVTESGLTPMPVHHQMELQWTLIVAGLEQVAARADPY